MKFYNKLLILRADLEAKRAVRSTECVMSLAQRPRVRPRPGDECKHLTDTRATSRQPHSSRPLSSPVTQT